MATAAERRLISTRPSDDSRTPEELERDAAATLQFFERLGKARGGAEARGTSAPSPRRGVVARHGRLVPWQKSVNPGIRPGSRTIPIELLASGKITREQAANSIPRNPATISLPIPPLFPRRTPQQRIESVFLTLLDDVLVHYKRTGQFDLPTSMMNELLTELWKQGKAVTLDDVREWAEPQIRDAIFFYVETLFNKVNNRYDSPNRTPVIRGGR